MAMDFPASPTNGQVFVSGDVAYTWNGYAWIGGGIPAAGADAPSDGGEYVRVNGVWRLKEQSFDASGKAAQDITVPVGAKQCRIMGSVYNSTIASTAVILQASFDGTTFAAGAGDYINAGAQHDTGTGGYQNLALSTTSSVYITPLSTSIDYAHVFTFECLLIRPSTTQKFNGKVYSGCYDTSSTAQGRHQWNYAFLAVNAAITQLTIKALRIFPGGNFGPGSTINAQWIY
jgi:hypothetical protein